MDPDEALAASLRKVADDLGSYDEFAAAYPVTIVPPLPAYPLFPILHLSSFRPTVYRVLNRSNRDLLTQIVSTGRLPLAPHPAAPVLRRTPRGHWCAYEAWATPDETRQALQILPAWSDCAARAIIDTRNLEGQAYVAYSVDPNDADTRGLTFHGYFYETVTQDHDDAPYEYDGDARSNLRLRRTASRRSRGMGYGQRAMGEDLDACLRHATQAIARVAALVLRGDSSPSSSVTRSATRYSSISTIELAALLDCASVERCVRVAARHDNVYGSSSESRRV